MAKRFKLGRNFRPLNFVKKIISVARAIHSFLYWVEYDEDEDGVIEDSISLFLKATLISVGLNFYYFVMGQYGVEDFIGYLIALLALAYVDFVSVGYLICGWLESLM